MIKKFVKSFFGFVSAHVKSQSVYNTDLFGACARKEEPSGGQKMVHPSTLISFFVAHL